jgi:hypothetical protein
MLFPAAQGINVIIVLDCLEEMAADKSGCTGYKYSGQR